MSRRSQAPKRTNLPDPKYGSERLAKFMNMIMNDGKKSVAANHLRYGASPRGLQAIVRAARITALFAGRAHVAIEDVARVALPALRHRVLLKVESELEGIDADTVLREIVETWLNAH